MPVITVEAASLSLEQKRKLTQELTSSAAAIMNMPKETIYVFLRENPMDCIGVGGTLLSDRAPAGEKTDDRA